MTFEDFIRSVLGLITAITALLASLAAFYSARRQYAEYFASTRQPTKTSPTDDTEKKQRRMSRRQVRRQLLRTAIGGFLLGVAVTLFAAWIFRAPLRPKITITRPQSINSLAVELIETGSAKFDIAGTSSGVFGHSERRIFVLVHPEGPSAPGWWIQPDVAVDPSGEWNGLAWIGNAQSQARPGHRLAMMAVIAANGDPLPVGSDGVPWVRDPAVLEPMATSNVVHARIGAVSGVPATATSAQP